MDSHLQEAAPTHICIDDNNCEMTIKQGDGACASMATKCTRVDSLIADTAAARRRSPMVNPVRRATVLLS
jgi:hypothetical protein